MPTLQPSAPAGANGADSPGCLRHNCRMKLRIRGDSIRLRLTQGEVARIGAGEAVSETTSLGAGARFEYALESGAVEAMTASLSDSRLVITAPHTALAAWSGGNDVAVDCPVSESGPSILVEKDFACLSPREGGDDDDAYPHPESGSATC